MDEFRKHAIDPNRTVTEEQIGSREGDFLGLREGAVRRVWRTNGLIHRDDDLPAVEVIEPGSDKVVYKEWWAQGLVHRDGDKPAAIREWDDGTTAQFWYKFGLRHRDGDKPAIVDLGSDGKPAKEFYFQFGRLHRDVGPAKFLKDEGNLIYETWSQFGREHRTDGPSNNPIPFGDCHDTAERSYRVNGVDLDDAMAGRIPIQRHQLPNAVSDPLGSAPPGDKFTPEV